MPKFIVTVRSISGDAFTGGLGAIRYLSVPDGAVPTPAHQVARTAWIKQVMQTFVRNASGNATGDLLFLVHGFNTDFTNTNALHDAVTAGLAGMLVCTIVSFDWPSAGETFAYLEDLDTAKRTAVDLVNAAIRPLIAAQTEDCRVAVHFACHSMGAYVAREAFDHADDGTTTGSDWLSISSCLSPGMSRRPTSSSATRTPRACWGTATGLPTISTNTTRCCRYRTSSALALNLGSGAWACHPMLRRRPSTWIVQRISTKFVVPGIASKPLCYGLIARISSTKSFTRIWARRFKGPSIEPSLPGEASYLTALPKPQSELM